MVRYRTTSLLKTPLLIAAACGLYFLAALGSLRFATLNDTISPFWPPTGIAIGTLLLLGRKSWPAIFLGAFLANATTSVPFLASFSIAVGNTLEAAVGASLFVYLYGRRSLGHYRRFFGLLLAPSVGALFSASVGVATLYFTDKLGNANPATSWLTWWAGDFYGGILILPAALSLKHFFFRSNFWKLKQNLSFVGLVLLYCAFGALLIRGYPFHPLVFFLVLFPALLTRIHGPHGAFVGNLIFCIFAFIHTFYHGHLFQDAQMNSNLLELSLLLSLLTVTTSLFGIFRRLSAWNQTLPLTLTAALVTCIFFGVLQTREKNQAQEKFKSITTLSGDNLRHQMELYVESLRNASAFIASSHDVSREEWKKFVTTSNILERHPGINGMGLVHRVPHSQLKAFEKQIQREGEPHFHIFPVPSSPFSIQNPKIHYPITQIEPYTSNAKALGLDLASEKHRSEAAEESMRTGHPTATRRIILVQDQKKGPGFLLFLPFYKNGAIPDSESERVRTFQKWVYAPFMADAFFSAAVKALTPQLAIQVFDSNPNENKLGLIYNTDPQLLPERHLSREETIRLNERDYWIRWIAKPALVATFDRSAIWIACAFFLFTLVLIGFFVNLGQLTVRAQRMARQMVARIERQQVQIFESSRLASLGEMAGGIAHEINNPLAIIMARTENIKRELETNEINAPKAIASMEKVMNMVERISKIIRGLRAFSRDSEHDPYQPVSLKQLISDTLELSHERVKRFSVDLQVDEVPPVWISCRGVQVGQVVLNLLNNAFDVVEELPERWIKISVSAHTGTVTLRITNSGPLIPEDIKNRVFNPFFTTKGVGKGTGLGLSISKGIMEEHGGKLYIANDTPHTTFVMVLPTIEAPSLQNAA